MLFSHQNGNQNHVIVKIIIANICQIIRVSDENQCILLGWTPKIGVSTSECINILESYYFDIFAFDYPPGQLQQQQINQDKLKERDDLKQLVDRTKKEMLEIQQDNNDFKLQVHQSEKKWKALQKENDVLTQQVDESEKQKLEIQKEKEALKQHMIKIQQEGDGLQHKVDKLEEHLKKVC